MAATIRVARYERPTEIVRSLKRWTIVSRFGHSGEHLTLSVADIWLSEHGDAPIGICPGRTALAILLSEHDDETLFLLVRHLPHGINVAGSFYPAEGYLRLRGGARDLQLVCEGRSAHSRGLLDGQDVRFDVPEPAPGAKWAMSWHIDAVRRPWSGEFYASALDHR